MVNHMQLGGKTRPILFGNYVFRKMKMEMGISMHSIISNLSDPIEQDFNIIVSLVFYALKAGEIATQAPSDNFTHDDVAVWMDLEKGSFEKTMLYLGGAMASMAPSQHQELPPEQGETKKKK